MPYLSELKIEPATIVRKNRRLPLRGTIHVSPGDDVTAEQEVARTELLPGEPTIVNVAKQLSVSADQISEYVTVKLGEEVQRGQVIARRVTAGITGSDMKVLSPCDGAIEHISLAYGQVLIREEGDPVNTEVKVELKQGFGATALFQTVDYRVRPGDEIRLGQILAKIEGHGFVTSPVTDEVTSIDRPQSTVYIRRAYKPAVVQAYIPGRVVKVDPGESVTIETPAAFIQGVFGIGGEQHGELVLLASSPRDELRPEAITPAVAGKVIIGGAFAGYEALARAAEVGARGVIVGGARAADLGRLAGRNIGIGVTGNEEIRTAIVLTEGFGPLTMSERTFALLRAHSGRRCSLCGASQIRAGVIRPEVIIPLPATTADECAATANGNGRNRAAMALTVGTLVRIIREPHFGAWGHVAELPGEPVLRPTGARMPVLRVRLESGETIEVLDTNVELSPNVE